MFIISCPSPVIRTYGSRRMSVLSPQKDYCTCVQWSIKSSLLVAHDGPRPLMPSASLKRRIRRGLAEIIGDSAESIYPMSRHSGSPPQWCARKPDRRNYSSYASVHRRLARGFVRTPGSCRCTPPTPLGADKEPAVDQQGGSPRQARELRLPRFQHPLAQLQRVGPPHRPDVELRKHGARLGDVHTIGGASYSNPARTAARRPPASTLPTRAVRPMLLRKPRRRSLGTEAPPCLTASPGAAAAAATDLSCSPSCAFSTSEKLGVDGKAATFKAICTQALKNGLAALPSGLA